jgi:flagellar biosynthesis GTPase FlhF
VVGRAYLATRGIDDATIRAAEQAGVLRYTAGAVLLVARDERGEARHVLRRGYREDDPHPKRVLAGSDTAHPVVLRGDPRRVVVAEGPITGLAAHSLARLRGEQPPTVVVTGGVAMRKWVRVATDVLKAAAVVEIAAEREGDPERQAATDAARARLAEAIQDTTGRAPRITWPAPGAGDLADELAQRRAEERRRREQEEEAARLEEERQRRAEKERRRAEEERREQARQAEEERRRLEEEAARRAEAERRRQAEEQRRRATPEGRRQAILEEERRRAAHQFAQARSSEEREAVEAAARMRAADRWRAEGIAPQEPRYTRRRQQDAEWQPPAPRF